VARLLADVDRLELALAGAPLAEARRTAPAARQAARRSARFAFGIGRRVAVQRAEIDRLTARLHWLLGRPRAARQWWLRSVAEAERLGARPELARACADIGLRLLADSQAQLGGVDRATWLERSRRIFSELSLPWEAAEAEAQIRRAA
jgi:hypothetical protein